MSDGPWQCDIGMLGSHRYFAAAEIMGGYPTFWAGEPVLVCGICGTSAMRMCGSCCDTPSVTYLCLTSRLSAVHCDKWGADRQHAPALPTSVLRHDGVTRGVQTVSARESVLLASPV